MNPKQRVLSALAHKATESFPIQMDITRGALDRLSGVWEFTMTEETLLTVLHQHLVFARLAPACKVSEELTGEVDPWGVRWASDGQGIWVLDYPVAGLIDLRLYRAPDVVALIDWGKVARNVEQYDQEYCVVGYHNALLFERAWSLVGFERLLIEMVDQPLHVEAFLDQITEIQCEVARRFIRAGVCAVRTGDDWGGQQGMLFSPRLWRRMILPRLKLIWEVYQSHGIPIIHHSCGDIHPIIADLVDHGLDMLNPLQPEAMNLEDIAREYGQDLAFYGGISAQKILPFGAPEEVSTEVRRCAEILGKHGGYLIAPSQGITSDVPVENIRALLDTMLSFCT